MHNVGILFGFINDIVITAGYVTAVGIAVAEFGRLCMCG